MSTKIIKPSTIRNLTYLAPEGSLVGAWNDKKDEDQYFVARTTKLAAWSDAKKRSDLTGPLTLEEAIAAVAKMGKPGRATLDVLEAMATSIEDEAVLDYPAKTRFTVVEVIGHEVEMPGVEFVDLDEEFEALLARAEGRAPERNAELAEQCKAEFEAIAAREDADTDKRKAQAARKLKMALACAGVVG